MSDPAREYAAIRPALAYADPLRLYMAAWHASSLEAEERRERERQERIRHDHPAFWPTGPA